MCPRFGHLLYVHTCDMNFCLFAYSYMSPVAGIDPSIRALISPASPRFYCEH